MTTYPIRFWQEEEKHLSKHKVGLYSTAIDDDGWSLLSGLRGTLGIGSIRLDDDSKDDSQDQQENLTVFTNGSETSGTFLAFILKQMFAKPKSRQCDVAEALVGLCEKGMSCGMRPHFNLQYQL